MIQTRKSSKTSKLSWYTVIWQVHKYFSKSGIIAEVICAKSKLELGNVKFGSKTFFRLKTHFPKNTLERCFCRLFLHLHGETSDRAEISSEVTSWCRINVPTSQQVRLCFNQSSFSWNSFFWVALPNRVFRIGVGANDYLELIPEPCLIYKSFFELSGPVWVRKWTFGRCGHSVYAGLD